MGNRFPKCARLLTRRDFGRVKKQSTSIKGKFLYIEYILKRSPCPRMGICASKKFGKSFERNRFKRQAREAFRKIYSDLPSNLEMIVKPRYYAHRADSEQIMEDMEQCLKTSIRNKKTP